MAASRYAWTELLAATAVVGLLTLLFIPPISPLGGNAEVTSRAGSIGTPGSTQLTPADLPPTGKDCRLKPGRYVRGGPVDGRRVALTFDDGPSNFTASILHTLRKYKVRATFFVNGVWIPGREHLLREELAKGNEIGNHTQSHAQLPKLTRKQIDGELGTTQDRIQAATGFTPCLFRPPYGSIDARVTRILRRHKLAIVAWNVDSADYERLGSKALANYVVANARPGMIVLMHDGVIRRQETVNALPRILRGLRRRHLTPVTVSQLFAPFHEARARASAGVRAGSS